MKQFCNITEQDDMITHAITYRDQNFDYAPDVALTIKLKYCSESPAESAIRSAWGRLVSKNPILLGQFYRDPTRTYPFPFIIGKGVTYPAKITPEESITQSYSSFVRENLDFELRGVTTHRKTLTELLKREGINVKLKLGTAGRPASQLKVWHCGGDEAFVHIAVSHKVCDGQSMSNIMDNLFTELYHPDKSKPLLLISNNVDPLGWASRFCMQLDVARGPLRYFSFDIRANIELIIDADTVKQEKENEEQLSRHKTRFSVLLALMINVLAPKYIHICKKGKEHDGKRLGNGFTFKSMYYNGHKPMTYDKIRESLLMYHAESNVQNIIASRVFKRQKPPLFVSEWYRDMNSAERPGVISQSHVNGGVVDQDVPCNAGWSNLCMHPIIANGVEDGYSITAYNITLQQFDRLKKFADERKGWESLSF